MSSIIRATTTSGLQVAPDNSGSLQLQTNGTTAAVTIDTSQNVGIGVTPSPWGAAFSQKALQISSAGALMGLNAGTSNQQINVVNNAYFDGANWKYITSDGATIYAQNTAGLHQWSNAASGTAGNTVTFAERMRIDSSGNVLVTNPSGLGYGTGSGGTVTQATNKTTGVTLNKPVGQITTASDALGAGASAAFTVTNSVMSGTDVVIVNSQNINYSVRISDMAGGSFKITIKNESGGSLSQAVVIGFSIIKGAIS